MFELVTKTLGQKAIVVDADDLLEQPGKMMWMLIADSYSIKEPLFCLFQIVSDAHNV